MGRLTLLCLLASIVCQCLGEEAESTLPKVDDDTCLLQSFSSVAHGHQRLASKQLSSEKKLSSSIADSLQKFKITGSSLQGTDWDHILEQLHKSFTPATDLHKFSVRGQGGGICPSCQADGQIYKAANFTSNENAGDLDSVSLFNDPGHIANDSIHAIDEYRLGEGTTPFRWCGILCKKWSVQKCLRKDDSRQNLWTKSSVERWAKWIEPGSNVIDIGANVGDTTVEMAIRAKQTLAFEANPRAALHCQTHALLNPQLNIKVHPVALATSDGTMDLNVDCDGCNSGPAESMEWMGTIIQVPQKRLDTLLLHEYGEDFLRNVSFIKIDTEGFDKTLLRTYKPLLRISRPTFWVEWFDPYKDLSDGAEDEVSEGSRDLFAAIQEIGYVALNPNTMKVVTPESRNGIPDLLLLPAEKVFPDHSQAIFLGVLSSLLVALCVCSKMVRK